MGSETCTMQDVVEALENRAELHSFPKPKYNEQHVSLVMDPESGPWSLGLFNDGLPPVHESLRGDVPDFREQCRRWLPREQAGIMAGYLVLGSIGVQSILV